MPPASALVADRDAADLAMQMLERDDVVREVLQETIDSARDGQILESGRTVCGNAWSPKGPIERRYSTITLPQCPIRVGGSWHTHVTRNQLLNPENSLPDIANVVFGEMDVSIVAGAESSHVVIAAADRPRMVQEFNNTLGIQATSTSDVVDAVLDARIQSPPQARARLHDVFGRELMFRVDEDLQDLVAKIRDLEIPSPADFAAAAPGEMIAACVMYDLYAEYDGEQLVDADHPPLSPRMSEHIQRFNECGHRNRRSLHQTADGVTNRIDLIDLAISQTAATIIGEGVSQLLFP